MLSRRLLLEFAKVFVLTLALLLLFILMGRALQLRDMLLGLELGLADTLRLFACLSPLFLLMLCPVACMVSVFLTFLRMGADRELLALRAGGVSLYQMLPASLFFASFCALFSLWLGLWGQGWGMAAFRAELLAIAENRVRLVVRPGQFNKDLPHMTFFARRADVASGVLNGVFLEDASRPGGTMTILAPEGSLGTDYARGDLFFLLKNGRVYTEHAQSVTVLGFEEYVLRMSLGGIFQGLDLGPIKPKEMTWGELAALPAARIFLEDERLANKIVVERHKRWVFPAACFILCLFAIPVAVSCQGLRRQNGLMLALALFLVYYSLLSMGISMAEAGKAPALPALWGPNLLFLLLACFGFHLAAREHMPRLAWNTLRPGRGLAFGQKPKRARDPSARRKAGETPTPASGAEAPLPPSPSSSPSSPSSEA